jgi:hypothetical protein
MGVLLGFRELSFLIFEGIKHVIDLLVARVTSTTSITSFFAFLASATLSESVTAPDVDIKSTLDDNLGINLSSDSIENWFNQETVRNNFFA